MLRRLFPNVYEGWIVVGSSATVVLIIGAALFYGLSLFFNELIAEIGLSVAMTSIAFSLRSELNGIAAPFIGIGIDRYGPRAVTFFAVTVCSVGVLLLSMVQNSWQFFGVMVILAIGSSGGGGQTGLAAIATWFERRRSLAMSFSTLGGGVAGVLVVGIAWLIEVFGWRPALQILAGCMLVFGFGFGMQIRSRPVGHPQPMDGRETLDATGTPLGAALRWGIPLRQAVRTRAFLLSALAVVLLSFSTTAISVHLVPYVEREFEVSKRVAGSTIALYTLMSIVGRLGLGTLGDRYPKRMVIACCGLLIGSGTLLLALATNFPMVLVAIALVAPGFGGIVPVRPAMMADYFGTKHFGTINVIAAAMNTTGGAIGPSVVGYLVDLTGAYLAGWYVCVAVSFLAMPVALLAPPPHELVERYRREAEDEREADRAAPPRLASE